jgi:putative sterol carrier protein
MATVRELMDVARRMIAENPEQAKDFGAVYKLVLDGEDGGTFVLDLKDNPGVRETDAPAQCTIKMKPADLVRVVEGKVDSRQLFFTGKLKVEGDYGLALKLKSLFKTIMAGPGLGQ